MVSLTYFKTISIPPENIGKAEVIWCFQCVYKWKIDVYSMTLREKCPNTEFILVRIFIYFIYFVFNSNLFYLIYSFFAFLHSDWIQRFADYTITLISMFFQNTSSFSTQHALLALIEKMKSARDNKQFCAPIFTDLSKAFDCICHDLLLAKPNAYGFDRNALKRIYDYRNDKSQKTKVGFLFSAYLDIIMVYHRDLYLDLCCLI